MVEQWSSKPYAWVRFLLSLFIISSHAKIKSYQAKKILIKINKSKLYTNTSKPGYSKLYKKISLNVYKSNKFITKITKIKINPNSKLKWKKYNSPRLTLIKSKWNKFWYKRQNSLVRQKNLVRKTSSSTFFTKNYFFTKESQMIYVSLLTNLFFSNKYKSILLDKTSNNHISYITSLNQNKSLFTKINQKLLKKNKIFDLNPNFRILHNKINNYTISSNKKLNISFKFWSFFLYFIYEQKFIYNNNQNQKSSFVLSKIPFYKMDPISPVTADKNRGNIYKKLSLINLKKLNKSFTAINNLTFINYNIRFISLVSSIQSQLFNPTKLSWINQISQLKQNQKYYSILKENKKHYKLYSNFTFLKTLVISKLKNKKTFLTFLNLKPKFKSRKKYKKFKPFDNKRLIRKQNFLKKKLKYISKKNNTNKLKTSLFKKINFKKHKPINKIYKNHIIFATSFLNWRINKRINMFNSFNRLSIKRKQYLMGLTNLNNHIYTSHNFHSLNSLNSRSKLNKTWLYKKANLLTQNSFSLFKLNSCNFLPTNSSFILHLLTNKLLYKIHYLNQQNLNKIYITSLINFKFNEIKQINTNLIPHNVFKKSIKKKVLNSFSNKNFNENIIPWYFNTFIRFIEHCSGKKTLFQFYPFLAKSVLAEDTIRYKRWLPRMVFYERKLGHRFFMEEALYLIHLSFTLKDPKIFSSWLKAIILRISFWKTRSIFRFIKYLFHNYFRYVFSELNIKGIKIKLKGKISAAGNSRKRTILYRVGKTSHSETNLRVLYEPTTVNTFTGVMGLGVWIFY